MYKEKEGRNVKLVPISGFSLDWHLASGLFP